jgi:hypothetical protein
MWAPVVRMSMDQADMQRWLHIIGGSAGGFLPKL